MDDPNLTEARRVVAADAERSRNDFLEEYSKLCHKYGYQIAARPVQVIVTAEQIQLGLIPFEIPSLQSEPNKPSSPDV